MLPHPPQQQQPLPVPPPTRDYWITRRLENRIRSATITGSAGYTLPLVVRRSSIRPVEKF
jgi:hypothetical protein